MRSTGCDCGDIDHCLSPGTFPGGAAEEFGGFALKAAKLVQALASGADTELSRVAPDFGYDEDFWEDDMAEAEHAMRARARDVKAKQSKLTRAMKQRSASSGAVDDDASSQNPLAPLQMLALHNSLIEAEDSAAKEKANVDELVAQRRRQKEKAEANRAAAVARWEKEGIGRQGPRLHVSTGMAWYLVYWACVELTAVNAGARCELVEQPM